MKKYTLSSLAILCLLFFHPTNNYGTAYFASDFPMLQVQMPCPGGSGIIGGHIFQDFNFNGLDDQLGDGLAGIEVHLFACNLSGESQLLETAVSDANGDYFFSGLTDGQKYRIEFSTPINQSFLESGFNATDSRTSVQFVTSPSCEVNIGMANPDDYCEDDPKLIVPCYVNGDPLAAGSLSAQEDAIVCFNASDEGTRPAPTTLAVAEEVGATWGITYNKRTNAIYTSAILKRHVGLGTLGLGGIYKIDLNSDNPMAIPFINLNDLGINVGTYPSNSDRGLSKDINLPSNDVQAFDEVGKKGLGSITVSKNGNTLYAISLSDKTLYSIDISNGTPTSAGVKAFPIPDPNCTGGDFRPFALQIYNEEIYVGGICDAETSQKKSDLKAIVYRLDNNTFTEVLDFSLDFQKGLASRSCKDDRGWFPWTNQMPEGCFVSGNANIIVQPTPILSDIEFDADGNMILGFMDRIGNQVGFLNYNLTSQTELFSAFTGGDILKATPNPDRSFTLENNGTAGPHTTVGADNGEGPGGGEFFSFDVFEVAPSVPRPHSETAQGGLTIIKGSNQIIGTSLDPFGTFVNSGGVNYWNLETGEVRDPGYVVFRSSSTSLATFSKANGLGDITTLCGPAPIELGGRLWIDENTDGIQDPCEEVFPNIVITLLDANNNELGTTTTDDNGEYFFNNSNIVEGSIQPNTEYSVIIGSAEQTQTPLALLDVFTATAKNIGMGPNDDLNDSDVEINGNGQFFIPILTGGIGAVSHGNDAGFFEIPPPLTATITGLVFNDINEDGIQDANDPPIKDFIVTLFQADGTPVATTTTDNNGNYQFPEITEGSYYVEINYGSTDVTYIGTIPNAGNDDTRDSDFNPLNSQTPVFSFNPSQGNQAFDAGVIQPQGDILGIVFSDTNGNGLQDDNPTMGIDGVTVILKDCDGTIIETTTTSSNGTYLFQNLVAGNYIIEFDITTNSNSIDNYQNVPANIGTDDTIDSDLENNNSTTCITFDPTTGADIDAGFQQPIGAIVGSVFEDKNEDGIRGDDEVGIGDISVLLVDCNNNVVASTSTDANGNYSFQEILKGMYQVVFDPSNNANGIPNYFTSPRDIGGDDRIDSDIDEADNSSDCITFDPLQTTAIDAGFIEPIGTITGIVFNDLGGDGVQDPNELGLTNVEVYLLDCDDNIIATTFTDGNGNYSFGDLTIRDYKVSFNPATHDPSITDFQASPQGQDSDISPLTNTSDCISFDPTQGADINAGFVQPTGVIMGTSFYDLDGDGMQEPGEGPIAGITLFLTLCDGTVIDSTTTDNNGNYSFNDIKAGDYQIFVDPATNTQNISDFLLTNQNVGDEEMDSDFDQTNMSSDCIAFNPMIDANIDAGFIRPKGEIMGTVFMDTNEDGMQGAGEFGISSNVQVTLLDSNGNVVAETTTTENGNYFFDNVLLGDYQILVQPSSSYLLTSQDMGNDRFDSDVNPQTGLSAVFPFVPADGADIDAGVFIPVSPASIGDLVFKDCNNNGLFDIGEEGLANITVMLSGTNDLGNSVNLQTTTNSAGFYQFDLPRPGTFQLMFILSDDLTGIDFSSNMVDKNGVIAAFPIASGATINDIDVGIADIASPVLFNVPPDLTVNCNNLPDAPVTVKAVDNCDPAVAVNFSESVTTSECGSTITRAWNATDACGNRTERQQIITIRDEEAPVITLSHPLLAGIPNGGEVTFDCDVVPEFDESAVITSDNCDTDITIEFVDLIRQEGNCETDGFVAKMTCGWKAIDDCGNEHEYIITINVVDTKAPTLANIPADETINLEEGQSIPTVSTEVVGTDNCDEQVTVIFEQSQTEGGPCGYDIIRTWTALDNCGNKVTDSQTIRIVRNCECPEFLTDGRMVQDAACDGSRGGMILLNLTANARYYEFDYTPNLGTPNLLGNVRNNLPVGDYNITITYKGAENCSEEHSISIGTMEAGVVAVENRQKADCFQANGFIQLSPANYIYEWSDGIIVSQRSDLAAGSYKVNYTDAAGCQGSETILVEQPENCACLNFKVDVYQIVSPSCSGESDGSIVIKTEGGKEGISYEWSNGMRGPAIDLIPAGSYTITATDGNDCQVVKEIMLMDRESLMASISSTNGACGETGSIDLFVSGGTPPYFYKWSNGASTQDLTNIESGIYEVSIEDLNVCTTTASIKIENDLPIAIQLSKQLPSCEGEADGAIIANITGGTGAHTYLWSNAVTTKNNEGIAAGAYSLTVKDEAGCQETAQITVEDPTTLTLVLNATSPECGDDRLGSIDLQISGGTRPYQIAWDTGATSEDISDLPSGAYSVIVTDANGCAALGLAIITIPPPISISIANNSPVCANSLGFLRANVEGGTAPYSYQWSNGSTEKSITDVPTGTYEITITDANGCIERATTTIEELAPVQVFVQTTEAGCNGNGGDITLSIQNGMPPFQFNWSHGPTTQNLTNVSAGRYEGIMVDANGCSALMLATVVSSANIEANSEPIHPTCFEAPNGAIYVTVTSGTTPFRYLWNTGETTKDLIKIRAGDYQLTITDAQDCQYVISTKLTEPEQLIITEKEQTKALCDLSNGTLSIEANGGTSPYQYLWNTGATTTQLNNVPLGNYQVSVTDSKGCIQAASFTLESECTCPESLYSNIMVNHANCGNSDGRIMVMVDQIERYTFEWLPNIGIPGDFDNERSGLPSGNYRIRITYAGQSQCSEIIDIFLGNNEVEQTEIHNNVPADCDKTNGQIELSPSTSIYTWEDGIIGYRRTDLAAGIYQVIAMDVYGCMQTIEVVMGQQACIPCDLFVDLVLDKAPTCDYKRGQITALAGGGTNSYNFYWSSPIIGNVPGAADLPAGPYQVTVVDANNCEAIASINLPEPDCESTCNISASILTVDIKCPGTSEGAAYTNVVDGKPPFTYTWSNGTHEDAISSVSAGNYTVTITDAKGCSIIGQANIAEEAPLLITQQANFFDCEKVAINITIQGGVGPYKWFCQEQEGTMEDAILLAPGEYTCTIMDDNWCSVDQSILVLPIEKESCQSSTIETPNEVTTDTIVETPTDPNQGYAAFEFSAFEVLGNGFFAQLSWSTINESTEGQFVIKHSKDGVTFRSIDKSIVAQGPISTAVYQQVLEIPNYGKNYFQIQYVDIHGTITQSIVQEIFRDLENSNKVLVYPNPVRSSFTVDFLQPATHSSTVVVTDNLGNTIEQLNLPSGTTTYLIDTQDYQPGVYFLTVGSKFEKEVTLRLVKIEE